MSSTVLGLPLLSTVIFLPLFGVIFLLFIRGSEPAVSRNARAVTLLTSLATFALSLMVIVDFNTHESGFQDRKSVV